MKKKTGKFNMHSRSSTLTDIKGAFNSSNLVLDRSIRNVRLQKDMAKF